MFALLTVTDVARVITGMSARMLVSPSVRRSQPTATGNLGRVSTSSTLSDTRWSVSEEAMHRLVYQRRVQAKNLLAAKQVGVLEK